LAIPQHPRALCVVPPSRSRGAALVTASRSPKRLDAGPSNSSRRGLLQGFSPTTSPLPEATVAGGSLLVPSMGFVPLQGSSCTAPTRPCLVGDPRLAEAWCVPFLPPSAASRIARAGASESLLGFTRALEPKLGKRDSNGGPKPSRGCRRLFSVDRGPRWGDPPLVDGRSHLVARGQCPEKSVRCAKFLER
jgi:hypothetical protein